MLNLSEMTKKIAKANVQKVDAIVAKYLEESIKHITERGDKIEDYALVFVPQPMEFKADSLERLEVRTQYRICRIDELQDVPVYND